MKAKRTMRDIKSQYPTIIQVSYCDAQNMLCIDDPAAIRAGAYSVWDAERITGAFNFGHGTQADFERHKKANSALHLFMEV